MKFLSVMVSAVALSAALAGPARAVDLWDTRSGDGPMWDSNITVIENGQERHFTMMNGDMLRNVCSDCTIKVEDGNTVQASKDDMVEVRGTSLSVRHVTGAYAASPARTQEAQLRGSAAPMAPAMDQTNAAAAGGPSSDALSDPFDGPEGGN